jgi:hypothetical protein
MKLFTLYISKVEYQFLHSILVLLALVMLGLSAMERLYILDYKYGQGLGVSPIENDQLKYYAAGVIETFKLINAMDRISLVIVQPRCGGVSRMAVCSLGQLQRFVDAARVAVLQSQTDNPPMQAGDHCRWCAAQAVCPVKRKEVEDLFNVDLQAPSIVKESRRI